ncbi:hypothetical protein ACMFL9_01750 (plasmid) [Sinorhizobium meliloti]
MFSAEEEKAVGMHLSERALAVFDVLLEILRHGQAEGSIRNRPIEVRLQPAGGSSTA